jgi:hypothetical protein
MICVSIAEDSVDRCLKALNGLDLAEIRMVGMSLSERHSRGVFPPVKLVPHADPDECR